MKIRIEIIMQNAKCEQKAKCKMQSEGSCGENRESEPDVGGWEMNHQPTIFNQSKSLETPFLRATWLDFHFTLTAALGMLVQGEIYLHRRRKPFKISLPPRFLFLVDKRGMILRSSVELAKIYVAQSYFTWLKPSVICRYWRL